MTADFRRRFGLVETGAPITADAPRRARAGYLHVLEEVSPLSIGVFHNRALQIVGEPPCSAKGIEQRVCSGRFRDLVLTCEWPDFFAVVEGVREAFAGSRVQRYDDEVNELLAAQNIAYELRDGILRLRADPDAVAAENAALSSLIGKYALYRDQLDRALQKLTLRQFDPANAVKDAVGALEGVVRTRLGKKRGDLGDLRNELKGVLHPALGGSIDALLKIEAFRGAEAAHASTDRGVSEREALFVVHQCSAAIAFIVSNDDTE